MGTLGAEFEVRWSNLQEPLLAGVQKQSEDEEVDPQKHVASLISSAGLLSLATFSWINPLLALGYRKHLTIEDVPPLPPGDQDKALYKTFDGVWQRLKHDHLERTPSIALALIKTFWVSVLLMGAFVHSERRCFVCGTLSDRRLCGVSAREASVPHGRLCSGVMFHHRQCGGEFYKQLLHFSYVSVQ
jgi:hypothetical protein